MPKHPGGRPRKIKDVQELQQKIKAYFDRLEAQPPLEREPVTITGLVLACGYCDLTSFYEMEKRKEFRQTIKAARTLVTNAYERRLHSQNAAGAIFALKNFGWRDDYQGRPIGNQPTPKFIFYIGDTKREMKVGDLLSQAATRVPDSLQSTNGV